MARLPDSLQPVAPRGARPSGLTVRPTDYGLGDLAQSVAALGEAQMKRDDRAADRLLQAAQAGYEPQFGERAAGYDGREAGFAARETAAFDTHFNAVLEDPKLSGGVRFALRRQLDAYKAALGRRAIGVETERRAGVVADQQRVKVEARTGEQLVGFNDAFAKRYQARVDAYDGSDGDFAANVLGDFDETAKATLEAAPEDLKPRLEASFAARRVQVHAQALEAQDKGHDAFVADNADKTVSALTNTVLSNPAAYGQTLAGLDAAAAGVPQALRKRFLDAAQGELASARIEGLILKDDPATAKAELADGRYDKVLQPSRKEALLARIEAAERGGPKTLDDWRRAYQADQALDAEVDARARGQTTGFTLQAIGEVFTPREQAAAEQKLRQADQVFAATGNLKVVKTAELRDRAMAPPPDPAQPGYADKQRMWVLSRKAAADELEARQKDPAAWAMRSDRQGDTGDTIQAAQGAWLEKGDATSAASYASLALGYQEFAGMDPASMRVLPKDQAADLVQGFAGAAPEAKGKALAALTAAWGALPATMRLQDGRTVNPRAMAARELRAAGLSVSDVSAMTDLADDPGRLQLYGEATANPNALKALTGQGEEARLGALVESRLKPFFATADALAGSPEQNAGRLSRARITARHLMSAKGLSAKDAAEQATADLTDGYRFVDGWRMPKAIADRPAGAGGQNWQRVRRGAGLAMADLIGGEGAGLYPAPAGPALTEAQRRAKAADILEDRGRWVTTEDDKALLLMVPTARGWTPAPDRYGRPVRLTWPELEAIGRGDPGRKALGWMAPGPAAALPARVSPKAAREAFAAALEHRESRGDPGAVSPAGAVGVRQLMVGTARWQAKHDKLTLFDGRSDDQVKAMLLADPSLNRRISDAHIAFLSSRYDGNVGLIAAAYNAGWGATDKWLASIGDPRKGRITLDEWVAHIPIEETRNYVRGVLPGAMSRLRRAG